MQKDTTWNEQVEWYSNALASDRDSYQENVIKPNIIRLVAVRLGETILDLACGSGFFSTALAKEGVNVIGVDVAPALIAIARKQYPKIIFHIAPADQLAPIADKSINQIICIMAIQNIDNVRGVFAECKRVLKSGGKIHIVMNHPAFRIPKQSSWGWDEKQKTQYRRVDSYLSERKILIQMHPGDRPKETTISFHRPLQYYAKLLKNAGFAITNIEEWTSHRRSQPGSRAKAENIIRHEIPLFLYLQASVIASDYRERGNLNS